MTTLLILRGVPASGKSTYAVTFPAANPVEWARVNRDDIRFTMFGRYWGVDESVVTAAENAMIQAALAAGKNVVLDATNLNAKALKTKLSLASRYGAEVEYMDFPVSLALATARDSERDRSVGAAVLASFFERYKIDRQTGALPKPPSPLPRFERYVGNPNLPAAYIVDTDGTVADHEGIRSPYDTSKYAWDRTRQHVATVVDALDALNYSIIALSGRDEEFRDVTEAWWQEAGIPFTEFHLRPKGDKRMDALVKYELFKEHIEPKYNVLAAFDDRPQVIRMWETIGVPVINVGTGEEF